MPSIKIPQTTAQTTALTAAKKLPLTENTDTNEHHLETFARAGILSHPDNGGTNMSVDNLNPTFVRRLIVAHLIHSQPHPCVPELMRLTGWPRRTLQDILKALPGLGLELEFVQDGIRNNAGYYQLNSWGAIDPQWVEQHRFELYRLLDLAPD